MPTTTPREKPEFAKTRGRRVRSDHNGGIR